MPTAAVGMRKCNSSGNDFMKDVLLLRMEWFISNLVPSQF
jgi:hypothetical protein